MNCDVIIFLMDHAFGAKSKNCWPSPRSWRFFLIFFSGKFIFMFCILSIIHFKLYLYKMWDRPRPIFLPMMSDCSSTIFWKGSFLLWIASAPLSKINWAYLCGATYRVSILFHWSVSIHLLLLHILDYYSYLISLEIGKLILHTLLFFFKITSAILLPLFFHLTFKITLLYLQKILAGILIGIMLNLYINLGRTDILLCCLPINKHGMSLHLFRPFLVSFMCIL